MNFYLKEKRLILLKEMEIIKTIVGHYLLELFTENVAFSIAEFLVESEEEKRVKTIYKQRRDSLKYALRDDSTLTWTKYFKNLKLSMVAVYSYNTKVIELNWERQTAKRLGKWSPTTSRHMNYAMQNLSTLGFKEIK